MKSKQVQEIIGTINPREATLFTKFDKSTNSLIPTTTSSFPQLAEQPSSRIMSQLPTLHIINVIRRSDLIIEIWSSGFRLSSDYLKPLKFGFPVDSIYNQLVKVNYVPYRGTYEEMMAEVYPKVQSF